MRWPLTASLVLIATAAPAAAQGPAATVAAGMPRDVVVARLGAPVAERTSGNATYLFYASVCEPACPVNDLVVLRGGRVADAIFVSPGRRYVVARDSGAAARPSPAPSPAPSHGASALKAAADRAGLRRGGLVLGERAASELVVAGDAAIAPRAPRSAPAAERRAYPDDAGPLYPPFGDPLLNEPPPLRVRRFVLPGTFRYAEPRRNRDYSPGAALR